MFTPIIISSKNTSELRNNVSQMSKKVENFTFYGLFMFLPKNLEKVGEKNPSWAFLCSM